MHSIRFDTVDWHTILHLALQCRTIAIHFYSTFLFSFQFFFSYLFFPFFSLIGFDAEWSSQLEEPFYLFSKFLVCHQGVFLCFSFVPPRFDDSFVFHSFTFWYKTSFTFITLLLLQFWYFWHLAYFFAFTFFMEHVAFRPAWARWG